MIDVIGVVAVILVAVDVIGLLAWLLFEHRCALFGHQDIYIADVYCVCRRCFRVEPEDWIEQLIARKRKT